MVNRYTKADMPHKQEDKEPFLVRLVQQILDAGEYRSGNEEGLTDKELFSIFALIIFLSAVVALTVGPYSFFR